MRYDDYHKYGQMLQFQNLIDRLQDHVSALKDQVSYGGREDSPMLSALKAELNSLLSDYRTKATCIQEAL